MRWCCIGWARQGIGSRSSKVASRARPKPGVVESHLGRSLGPSPARVSEMAMRHLPSCPRGRPELERPQELWGCGWLGYSPRLRWRYPITGYARGGAHPHVHGAPCCLRRVGPRVAGGETLIVEYVIFPEAQFACVTTRCSRSRAWRFSELPRVLPAAVHATNLTIVELAAFSARLALLLDNRCFFGHMQFRWRCVCSDALPRLTLRSGMRRLSVYVPSAWLDSWRLCGVTLAAPQDIASTWSGNKFWAMKTSMCRSASVFASDSSRPEPCRSCCEAPMLGIVVPKSSVQWWLQ